MAQGAIVPHWGVFAPSGGRNQIAEAKGEVVVAIGCNSGTLGPVVAPKNDDMSYIVLNGGSDSVTSMRGAVPALNALVGGYVKGDVKDGINAANAALQKNGRTDPRDKGDSLEQRGVLFETIEIQIPPETVPVP